MHYLSKLFIQDIQDIQDELQELTAEETKIVEKFKNIPPVIFKHQSKYNLESQGKLQIYSRDIITTINPKTKLSYHKSDIIVANTDFVFFSADVTTSKITKPPLMHMHGSHFYRENDYMIPEKFSQFGYVTLTDHTGGGVDYQTKFRMELVYDMGIDCITELWHRSGKIFSTNLNNIKPIFSLEDMRLGMALYAIKRIRNLDENISEKRSEDQDELFEQREKFIGYILSDDAVTQNLMLNNIFNLEYHIPGKIIAQSNEYSKQVLEDEHSVYHSLFYSL